MTVAVMSPTPTAGADHSRASSKSTVHSGSAYQLILEHIFSQPPAYELPLRTVFAQNCEPRRRNMHLATRGNSTTSSASSSAQSSPVSPDFKRQATADFTSSLVTHMAQLPSQPCSLPPTFIATFLRRCFSPELALVDFPQALTGLDYLKDLETRRRREHHAALARCGVSERTLRTSEDLFPVCRRHPGLESWMQAQVRHEKDIETAYTQLYVGLRRWILLNELMIQPFDKGNCLAMLNTLFPPIASAAPTSRLTPAQMKTQRDAYFKWILRIESHHARGGGSPARVLAPLMEHSKRPGDANAWMAVRETLDSYLRHAQRLIDDYMAVQGPDDFDMLGRRKASDAASALVSGGGSSGNNKKKERKADSGVSFGSDKRPSTSGTSGSSGAVTEPTTPTAADTDKPLPNSPGKDSASLSAKERSLSTLERLARELRRIKTSRAAASAVSAHNAKPAWSHSRTDSNGSNSSGSTTSGVFLTTTRSHGNADPTLAVEEPTAAVQKTRSLRKARSFTDVKRSMATFGGSRRDLADAEAFDEKEMKKQRSLWEQYGNRRPSLRV